VTRQSLLMARAQVSNCSAITNRINRIIVRSP
jgi:hypothetical protein